MMPASNFSFSSWQPQTQRLQLLQSSQPASYISQVTPSVGIPITTTSVSAIPPRQPRTMIVGQNSLIRPVAPVNVPVEPHTALQGLERYPNISGHLLYKTNNQGYVATTVPSTSNTLYLNPEANAFTPTQCLSATAVAFQPQSVASFNPNLSQSQPLPLGTLLAPAHLSPQPLPQSAPLTLTNPHSQALPQSVKLGPVNPPSQQYIVSRTNSLSNSDSITSPIAFNFTAMAVQEGTSVAPTLTNCQPTSSLTTSSNVMTLVSASPVNAVSSVSVESQTELTGTNWGAKLCDRCKDCLFGNLSQNVRSNIRPAPAFLKLKDISMQHKLKYLAMKAAVFVRESPSILSQPDQLKAKLSNRLSKMCSHFGVQSQTSISWQDDIACSVAVNLLAENPQLSSSQNNGTFLQQLKMELESHMEIAQDLLNQQEDVTDSTDTQPPNIDKANLGIDGMSQNVELKTVPGDEQPSFDKMWVTDNTPLTSYQRMDNGSYFSGRIPNVQTNINALLPNIGGGSVLNQDISNLNLPSNADSLLENNALNSNLIMNTNHTNIALSEFSASNINALSSNPQLASLLNNPIFLSNPGLAANLLNNNLQCNSSPGLLKIQQTYLEMLKRINNLNSKQQCDTDELEVEGTSDKLLSQLTQNIADYKLDTSLPPQISPSLSIEDDMSVSSNSGGQERMRHLSSSTSNSDSDHKVIKKKLHHGKDESGTLGSKKMAPLDFRKPKSAPEKPHISPDFDARLGALYVSVTSHDANDDPLVSNEFRDKLDMQTCKEELSKSSEPKPIRRLTPLQRKLLKKNEHSGDGHSSVSGNEKFKSLLPKTVEIDEQLASIQPSGDCTTFPMQTSFYTDEWKKTADLCVSASGDVSTQDDHLQIDSEILKRLKAKRLLHCEQDVPMEATKSQAQDVYDSHHTDSINVRHPRVIDRDLTSGSDQSFLFKPTYGSEDEWRKCRNPFVAANDDSSTQSDGTKAVVLTSDNRAESEFMKRLKSKKLLHNEQELPNYEVTKTHTGLHADTSMTQVDYVNGVDVISKSDEFLHKETPEAAQIWTPGVDDSIDKRTLGAIGLEFAQDIVTPQSTGSKFRNENDELLESNGSDSPTRMKMLENLMSNSQCELDSQTSEKHVSTLVAEEPNLEHLTSVVSNAVSNSSSSTPASMKDVSDSVYNFENDIEDRSQQSSSQFQSYSDIVKQRATQKPSMVVLKSGNAYDDNSNNNTKDTSHSSYFSNMETSTAVQFSSMGLDDIHVNPVTISSHNESASGSRTWSSLFQSKDEKTSKSSHGEQSSDKAKSQTVKNSSELKSWGNTKEVGADEESNSRSVDKFGKYGLDDFSSSPASMKVTNTSNHDTGNGDGKGRKVEREEKSTNQEESEWKMVKKSKKASQEMEILLKNFRTEDRYGDLCDAIAEQNPKISRQFVEDVLDTVFVEMEGVGEMADWEILEEVDVALTQMCPQEVLNKAGTETGDVDNERETSSKDSSERCPFQ